MTGISANNPPCQGHLVRVDSLEIYSLMDSNSTYNSSLINWPHQKKLKVIVFFRKLHPLNSVCSQNVCSVVVFLHQGDPGDPGTKGEQGFAGEPVSEWTHLSVLFTTLLMLAKILTNFVLDLLAKEYGNKN